MCELLLRLVQVVDNGKVWVWWEDEGKNVIPKYEAESNVLIP